MSRTSHICRIRIFSKSEDTFRMQHRDAGKLEYTTSEQFTIGQDAENDIVIAGNGIEAKHLKVVVKGREIWLEDLGGVQGTSVSGARLSATNLFPYKPGEVIHLGQSDEVMVIELFSRLYEPEIETQLIINRAREEAENILANAQKEIDEKSRDAIEEALSRARSMAKDLIASAKSEASFHIKEAQSMADTIAHEGEHRKNKAMELSARFETDNLKLLEKRKQLEEATARSQAAFEQALEKEQMVLKALEEAEREQAATLVGLEELQTALKILKQKLDDGEARLLEAQRMREGEQKLKNECEEQARQLESHITSLTERRATLVADIKSSEEKQNEWVSKLHTLEHQFDVELAKLRQKVDEEYQLQLKKHEKHIADMRERESIDQQNLVKRIEEFEERRLGSQVMTIHERLCGLIADRAALYGANKLRDNEEFKKDLGLLTATALKEEFELRRREVLVTLPTLARQRRRQLFMAKTSRYAGWAVSVCLLAFVVWSYYGNQLGARLQTRQPASTHTHAIESAANVLDSSATNADQ